MTIKELNTNRGIYTIIKSCCKFEVFLESMSGITKLGDFNDYFEANLELSRLAGV